MRPIITFGKIGQSLLFGDDSLAAGGQYEAKRILRLLARLNPGYDFVVIGKSDLNTIDPHVFKSLFPFGNVKYIYDGPYTRKVREYKNSIYYPIEAVKQLGMEDRIVGSILFPGAGMTTCNIPGHTRIDGKGETKMSQGGEGYVAPLLAFHQWLEETHKISPIEIVTDPNFTLSKRSKDVFFTPKYVLSQYDYEITKNTFKFIGTRETVETILPVKYAGIERSFMYDNPVHGLPYSRNRDFVMILNQGMPSRYGELHKWILSNNTSGLDKAEIYGQWESIKTIGDGRFKGLINYTAVHDLLKHSKTTFIIPIQPGWVTMKYLEMTWAGVIPFMHPSYDSQNHLNAPEWLRPGTPAELAKNISDICADDGLYIDRIQELRELWCNDDAVTGVGLNNTLMKSLVPDYSSISNDAPPIPEVSSGGLTGFFQ